MNTSEGKQPSELMLWDFMNEKELIRFAESLVLPLPEGMYPLESFTEIHANCSSGKDSVALILLLRYGYKVPKERIKIVHMDVDAGQESFMDWEETRDYLQYLAQTLDLPLYIIHGEKSLKQRILERGKWPAPGQQYCTSYTKRDIYAKWARSRGNGFYLCCSGERAEESPRRAEKSPFEKTYGPAHCVGPKVKRDVQWWRPVFHLFSDQVWRLIELAGIEPHPAYKKGMSRCSCKFCIHLSAKEMYRVCQLYPEQFAEIEEMEKQMGHTMKWKNGEPLPIREFIQKEMERPDQESLDLFGLPCGMF